MTPEQLTRMLGETSWEQFENSQFGCIQLLGLVNGIFAPVNFFMRVGLYFGRPTQAIMAGGHYIKMRPAPDYYNITDYILSELDPTENWIKPWRPATMYHFFATQHLMNVTWLGNLTNSASQLFGTLIP